MTIYQVPHISMGAELSSHFLESTRFVVVRQIAGIFVIAGIALDLIAWPAEGTAAVAGSVPPWTIRNLGIVYGPPVAVFAVLGPLSYRGYSLDSARHREILAALARRNEDSRTASDHDAT